MATALSRSLTISYRLTPHSGEWLAWLGGLNYELSILFQQVTVPTANPTLHYWHWIGSKDACGYDFGGVVINSSIAVDVYTLCPSTATNGWALRSVDLSAFAGQSVQLEFRAETDGSIHQ